MQGNSLTSEAVLDAKQRRDLFDEYGGPILEMAQASVPLSHRRIRLLLDRWWKDLLVSYDGANSRLDEFVAARLGEVEEALFADLRRQHPNLDKQLSQFQDPILEAFLEGLPSQDRARAADCWGRAETFWEGLQQQETQNFPDCLEAATRHFAQALASTSALPCEPDRWLREVFPDLPWRNREPGVQAERASCLPEFSDVKPVLFGCLVHALQGESTEAIQKTWKQVPWILGGILDQFNPNDQRLTEWIHSTKKRFTDTLLVERAKIERARIEEEIAKAEGTQTEGKRKPGIRADEAAGEIFIRYQRSLHAHIRAAILLHGSAYRNALDVEDFLQEVLGAKQAYLAYDPLRGNLSTFLGLIGKRRVQDAVRRLRRCQTQSPTPGSGPVFLRPELLDIVLSEALPSIFSGRVRETRVRNGLYFWLKRPLGYSPSAIQAMLELIRPTYGEVLRIIAKELQEFPIPKRFLPALAPFHRRLTGQPLGKKDFPILSHEAIPHAVEDVDRELRKLIFKKYLQKMADVVCRAITSLGLEEQKRLPHEILVFGFSYLKGWDPSQISLELRDRTLGELWQEFRATYKTFLQPLPLNVIAFFEKYLELSVGDLKDRRLRARLKSHHHKEKTLLKDTRLREYFDSEKCTKERKRVWAWIEAVENGLRKDLLFEFFDFGEVARIDATDRADRGTE